MGTGVGQECWLVHVVVVVVAVAVAVPVAAVVVAASLSVLTWWNAMHNGGG